MFHQLHLIKGTPEPMNRIVSRLEDTAFPDSQQRLGEKAAGKSHEADHAELSWFGPIRKPSCFSLNEDQTGT